VLHREPSKDVSRVSLDPRGQWLATGELAGRWRLMLWPLLGAHPFVLSRNLEMVYDAVSHPDGDAIIVASQDGSVTLWPLDPEKGQARRVFFRSTGAVANLDVDPKGRWVLAATYGGPWLIPLDGGEARSLPGFDSFAWAVTFSPDGRYAAAGGGHADHTERVIRIWDVQTFEEVQVLGPPDWERPGAGQIIDLAYTPDGKRLISSGWTGVLLWDLEDGSYEYLGDGAMTVLTRDGDSLYVVWTDWAEHGGAGVYDLETGELTELPSHGRAGSIALSPDEKFIVTGDVDGTIRVGPVNGEEPHLLMGHTDYVMALALIDDRWIVSGSTDGSLRVWPMPDLSRPPLHTLPREELLAKLRSFTNFRAVPDAAAPNGYRIDYEPISGWPTMPEW
jgi:WD40 repeat protein